MCDYSLEHVASRPARVEDKLVTTNFHNSITRGFAAVGEPHVAVCLRPGTELAFEHNVECEPAFGLLPNKKIGHSVARFRQINQDHAVGLQMLARVTIGGYRVGWCHLPDTRAWDVVA